MERTSSNKDNSKDDNILGEYWEVGNLDNLNECSIGLVPMMDRLHFSHKLSNAWHFFFVSVNKRMKDIQYTNNLVLNISCKTTSKPIYMLILRIDYNDEKGLSGRC